MMNKLKIAAILAGSAALAAPAFGSTIMQALSGGAGSYTLNDVEVVGILDSFTTNNTAVLQDSTGSIIDYHIAAATYVPAVGDLINLTATNAPYQDGAELTSTSGVSVISSLNPVPTPPVLTIPQFLAASNTSGTGTNGESIVTLDDVSFVGAPATLLSNTSYTLTDGTNTATFYGYKSYSNVLAGLGAVNALGGGNAGTLDITGYVDNFFGKSELYPLSVVAVPEPVSAGLLTFGCVAMLMRRRRTA
ncbi:MAG: PEP-CTERM sorting domain-containing protein [Tepidisphaeraceae bacterium]|jgi:hypothetical protein